MNYIKELKEAKFPFDWDRRCPQCHEEGDHSSCPKPTPTLSELMNECYKLSPYFKLRSQTNGYVVELPSQFDLVIRETPEEAIAYLWLFLKKYE